MAITVTPGSNPGGVSNSVINNLDPAKYTSLGDFIDEVNAPDVRASLIKTYGDQGITGFLKMTGAVTAGGSADEVTYWEEARLHQLQAGVMSAAFTAGSSTTLSLDGFVAAGRIARKGDILLVGGVDRCIVTVVTDTTLTAVILEGTATATLADNAVVSFPIVGNMFAQATDQPDRYLESNVVKRTNPYAIVKEVFKVSGSQATNVGYINLGNGDYRWYLKGEMDTRQRFLDKREMTMILGQKTDAAAGGVVGTEGYFAALEDRGLVTSGLVGSSGVANFDDLDAIVTQLDKQGAPAEYAMYVNTAQSLKMDNLIAGGGTGSTAGLAGSYGAFNNDKDMAANLGFASFARGGYTFHKHSWKLLNDPTLLGDGSAAYNGVMIPLAKVTDAKSGAKVAALEMNYKSANGYSREMEHWVTGGGVLGFNQNGKDVAEFNYRSECNLVTRAANQHVLIK